MTRIQAEDLPWTQQNSPQGKYSLARRSLSIAAGGQKDVGTWGGGHPFDLEIQLSQDGVVGRLLAEAQGLRLFALAGFYQRDDERLSRAPGRLKGVIGVAPAPFDL